MSGRKVFDGEEERGAWPKVDAHRVERGLRRPDQDRPVGREPDPVRSGQRRYPCRRARLPRRVRPERGRERIAQRRELLLDGKPLLVRRPQGLTRRVLASPGVGQLLLALDLEPQRFLQDLPRRLLAAIVFVVTTAGFISPAFASSTRRVNLPPSVCHGSRSPRWPRSLITSSSAARP